MSSQQISFLTGSERLTLIEACKRAHVTALVATEILAIAEGNAACAHLLAMFRDGKITAAIDDDGELRWSMAEERQFDAASAIARANAVITKHKTSDPDGAL